MKNILFVCIENSNRSQMAEAFAKIYGKEKVQAFSAGSMPVGKINPKAVEAMLEKGYDLSKHASKSVHGFRNEEFDFVVTMGYGDECPIIPAKHRIDWQIPDPSEMDKEAFRKVRDLIESKVQELLSKKSS